MAPWTPELGDPVPVLVPLVPLDSRTAPAELHRYWFEAQAREARHGEANTLTYFPTDEAPKFRKAATLVRNAEAGRLGPEAGGTHLPVAVGKEEPLSGAVGDSCMLGAACGDVAARWLRPGAAARLPALVATGALGSGLAPDAATAGAAVRVGAVGDLERKVAAIAEKLSDPASDLLRRPGGGGGPREVVVALPAARCAGEEGARAEEVERRLAEAGARGGQRVRVVFARDLADVLAAWIPADAWCSERVAAELAGRDGGYGLGPRSLPYGPWTARDVAARLCTAAAAPGFAGKVRAFLEEYLVSEEGSGTVPFGGRDPELESLDRWLGDEEGPARLVLAAPAGRGKSALLVHWMRRLEEAGRIGEGNGRWRLAFVPISMRFGTNRPEIFYKALAERLAEIVGEPLEPPRIEPAAYYENQCRILLDRIIERDLRVLLIVDGADEALGESFGAGWFPRAPGPHARVLVSARLQVGDRDARDWVARLGWTAGARAQPIDLSPLMQQGVADLLWQTGAPVDVLAARSEVTRRLQDLTEGEPLLLRLYVEDLWKRGDEAGRLTLDDLARITPGFSGYFRDWLERQRKAWADEGTAVDKNVLNAHLAVLACAYGRLTADELADLVQRAHGVVPSLRTEDVLHPIRRFVIGTGRHSHNPEAGYVLSHSKLGVFLREEYFPDRGVVEKTQRAFTAWGREVVQDLNNGALESEAAPPYLLQYFGQHLADGSAPAIDFMALVEEGWLRAWEIFEGGYRGFSQDVRRAANAVEREPVKAGLRWAWRLRCQLVLISITNIGSQVPGELLAECVRAGLLAPRQALYWSEYGVDETGALDPPDPPLIALAPHLPEQLLTEALRIAEAIGDALSRVRALAALAPCLPAAERGHVLAAALRAAEHDLALTKMQWGGHWAHARALGALAPHLPDQLLAEALRIAEAIEGGRARAHALGALAPHLPEPLLAEALRITLAIKEGEARPFALGALAPHLPATERGRVLDEALQTARAIQNNGNRAEALGAVAPHLPVAERGSVLAEALQTAMAIQDKPGNGTMDAWARARALSALAPHLPEPLLAEALRTARAIQDDRNRIQALAGLAPHLPAAERNSVLAEVLRIASTTRDFMGDASARLWPIWADRGLSATLRRRSEWRARLTGPRQETPPCRACQPASPR